MNLISCLDLPTAAKGHYLGQIASHMYRCGIKGLFPGYSGYSRQTEGIREARHLAVINSSRDPHLDGAAECFMRVHWCRSSLGAAGTHCSPVIGLLQRPGLLLLQPPACADKKSQVWIASHAISLGHLDCDAVRDVHYILGSPLWCMLMDRSTSRHTKLSY